MNMKILCRKEQLCSCCMEIHEVKTVQIKENTEFKGVPVVYDARYQYCDRAEELYMEEEQMQENDLAVKDAYRKKLGLLTSGEITDIRKNYGISQNDFCMILGWGGKTITRYEGHQVQDRAHDTILKKISGDPAWFLELLEGTRHRFHEEVYRKYWEKTVEIYEEKQDNYLKRAVEAMYVRFQDDAMCRGNAELSLDKVVDTICYFAASEKTTDLYREKLLRLLWYADAFSYKKRGHAITGLVYQAQPMGAVPVGQECLMDLQSVPGKMVEENGTYTYYFALEKTKKLHALSAEDQEILGTVEKCLGEKSREETAELICSEEAYQKTHPGEIILFQYMDLLKI